MEWYHIYLWTRLDSICVVLSLGAIFLGIALIVCGLLWSFNKIDDYGDDDSKKLGRGFKRCLVWFLIFLFPALLVPSSKEFAMMYVLPKIADSKVIQKDLPELYDMAIGELKDMIKQKNQKSGQ